MNNDAISRSAVRDAVHYDLLLDAWGRVDENDVLLKIDMAPALDVQPVVHARWIDLRESYKDIPRIECSNCKTAIIGLESNFCPKCGARMDAEEGV